MTFPSVRDDLAEMAVELSSDVDKLERRVQELQLELASWRDTLVRLAERMSVQGQFEVALRIGGASDHTVDHVLDTLAIIRKEHRE